MPQHAIWQPNLSCSDFSKPIHHHSPFYLCPVQTWQLFHMLLREVFQLIRLRTCGQARCDDSLHATCLPRTRSGNWVWRYDMVLPTGLGQNANGMPLLRSAELLFFTCKDLWSSWHLYNLQQRLRDARGLYLKTWVGLSEIWIRCGSGFAWNILKVFTAYHGMLRVPYIVALCV